MAKGKDLEKPEVGKVPVVPMDYGDDAGVGFENQTSEDYSIPFMNLLQSNSPEIEEGNPKMVEGAKPGFFLNAVTQAFYDGNEGVTIIPCHTDHVFVEWVPRNEGGGFIGLHELSSPVVAKAKAESKKFGKYKTGEGDCHDLVETFYIYGITYKDNLPGSIVVLAFTSTKIKAYKDYNTRMNTCTVPTPGGGKVRPPLFANRIKLTSVKTKNEKGTFYIVKFEPAVNGSILESLLNPSNEEHKALLSYAKDARELVVSGKAKANYETQEQTPQEDSSEGTAPGKAPF